MNGTVLITLPSDTAGAVSELGAVLAASYVLFVVFGSDPDAEALVDLAVSAMDPGEPWRVVWAPAPQAVEAEIRALDETDALPTAFDQVRACSVSFGNRVVEVFLRSDPAPDDLELTVTLVTAGGAQ